MEIPSMGTSQSRNGCRRHNQKRESRGGREASLSRLLGGSERKLDAQHIIDAAHAYTIDTPKKVRQLIIGWEVDLYQGVEQEIQVENWRILVTDPGNTRGRITWYK